VAGLMPLRPTSSTDSPGAWFSSCQHGSTEHGPGVNDATPSSGHLDPEEEDRLYDHYGTGTTYTEATGKTVEPAPSSGVDATSGTGGRHTTGTIGHHSSGRTTDDGTGSE
jgi:hypothetical protein